MPYLEEQKHKTCELNQLMSSCMRARKLRDDEKRHHDTLKKLSEKTFFRLDPNDFTVIMRGTVFAEERYKRSKEFWRKREED